MKLSKIILITFLAIVLILLNPLPSFASSVYTNGTNINLRAKPTTKSKALTQIKKKNTKLTVVTFSDTWTRVKYGNYTGFIRSDLVKLPNATVRKNSFYNTAFDCHEYLRTWRFSYSVSFTKKVPLDTVTVDNRYVDCSSYVSWALYEYGYTDFKGAQHTSRDFINIAKNLKNNGKNSKYYDDFKLVSKDNLKKGDILLYDGHVQIYAGGKNNVLNCGSDDSIRDTDNISLGSAEAKHKVNQCSYVLRVKK